MTTTSTSDGQGGLTETVTWPESLPPPWVTSLVVAGAGLAGLVLAKVGGDAGWQMMLGAPLFVAFGVLALFHPRVGLFALVVALPFGTTPVPLAPGDMKVVHLAALLATVAVLVHHLGVGQWKSWGWTSALGWLLTIYALALAATPGALDLPTAVKQDVALTVAVGLVIAVPIACRNLQELRPIVLLLLAVGAVACATSFGSAGQLHAAFNGSVVNNRAVGVFHQPNELGTFSGMVLMIAIGVFFGARSLWERSLAFVSAVACVTALALTLSRGAWIGAVLAALFVMWLLPSARRAVVVVGVPLVVLVAVFGAFRPAPPQLQILTERVQSITSPAANPYDDRPAIYREAVRLIESRPVLGVGPENFIVGATKSASETQTVAPLHAHNFLMTIAAELGIPAAFALIALTLSVGRRLRRADRLVRSADRGLAVGLGAALVVLVGQGLVDFTMRNPTIFVFVFFVLAMTLVAVRQIDHGLSARAPATSSGAGS
jgi:putative inorganic carbon (hco3(-)) transporter